MVHWKVFIYKCKTWSEFRNSAHYIRWRIIEQHLKGRSSGWLVLYKVLSSTYTKVRSQIYFPGSLIHSPECYLCFPKDIAIISVGLISHQIHFVLWYKKWNYHFRSDERKWDAEKHQSLLTPFWRLQYISRLLIHVEDQELHAVSSPLSGCINLKYSHSLVEFICRPLPTTWRSK